MIDRIERLFELQVSRSPTAIAVRTATQAISYRELDRRANAIGHALVHRGAKVDEPVALCLPRSIDAMASILGVLKAGAAYVPLDPTYPPERLRFMLRDSGARLVVTRSGRDAVLGGAAVEPLHLDAALTPRDDPPDATGSARDLAYILYTSGSTGEPKGVEVEHRGVCNLARQLARLLDIHSSSRVLQFTSLSFDASVADIFPALSSGAELYLASDDELLPGPALQGVLRERRVSVFSASASILEALPPCDLPHLATLVSGGEVCTQGLVDRWAPGRRFFNAYGPTEATVCATLAACYAGQPPTIGTPIGNVVVHLLDAAGRLVADGDVGEICIGGLGVARGYHGRPEWTAERFVPDPWAAEPWARLYRSGDLGRRRPDGSLEFVGRADQQIKRHGVRIELGEIQACLVRAPRVRAAAVVCDEHSHHRLVAYFVPSEAQAIDSPEAFVRAALPSFLWPDAVVPVDRLPLLPSGKLNRLALPDAPERTVRGGSPRTQTECALVALWADVLGLPTIGVFDDFFVLGGDSLIAAQLLSRMAAELGVEVSFTQLRETATPARLAQRLETAPPVPRSSHAVVPAPEAAARPFPLTDVQQAYAAGRDRLFELSGVSPHVYLEFECPELDIERFESAWRSLVERHPMLRSRSADNGTQRIMPELPAWRVTVVDLRDRSPSERDSALRSVRETLSHQVFDPKVGRPFEWRASLLPEGRVRLHLSLDFSVVDHRSLAILLDELSALNLDPQAALPPLALTFRDYVMTVATATPAEQRDRSWWQQRLHAIAEPPQLPVVGDPEQVARSRFVRRSARLEAPDWTSIQARARQMGCTPAVVLLTAYADVLRCWSASPRFTLNLPLFDRHALHPDVELIVGNFTSIALLTIEAPGGDTTFRDRVSSAQEALWDVLDHRRHGGVRVLRSLAGRSGNPRAAAMPIVFTSLLGSDLVSERAHRLIGSPTWGLTQTPQVLLDHQVAESAGALCFDWDAVERRFPDGLLDAMFTAYGSHLERVAQDEGMWNEAWSDTASALVPEATPQARASAHQTSVPPTEDLLQSGFRRQVSRRPLKLAIVGETGGVTYEHLWSSVSAHARRLHEMAVGGGRVAVMMDKGWQQCAAVLAALECGAAYVPVTPTLPKARREAMLERSGAVAAIVQRGRELPGTDVACLVFDESLTDGAHPPLEPEQRPDDVAYVLFTSGTTGVPKGVEITHRGAVNTLRDIMSRFDVSDRDVVFGISSIGFDLSVFDLFATLAVGATLVLPPERTAHRPDTWLPLIHREHVTVWNSVPALMTLLVEAASGKGLPCSLRLVLLSGDWIPVTLPGRISALAPDARIVSLGGATEASIWSICYPIDKVDPTWTSVPYGKPLANQTWHVLDEVLAPRPINVPGELYIGGSGLARGYCGDPEATSRSFVRHPKTGERLYRTGDFGRWASDGNIEFLGRRDRQVKVQGHRIELEEIEAALLAHPEIREAVVVASGGRDAWKSLVGYVVHEAGGAAERFAADEIRAFLARSLPAYMVPATLVALDELPLTPTGKVDREGLRQRSIDWHLVVDGRRVEPRTPTERKLLEVFEELLEVERVGIHDNFFDLGGDSLLALQAVARAAERQILISSQAIYDHPSVASLAEHASHRGEPVVTPATSPVGPGPLLPGQEWFFRSDLAHPERWCEPHVVSCRRALRLDLLQAAVDALVVHHDALRTRFRRDRDGWHQMIPPPGRSRVPVARRDLGELGATERLAMARTAMDEVVHSLDIERGVLLGGCLFEGGSDGQTLVLIGHHLILDGLSWRVLFEDLQRVYLQLERGGEIVLPAKTLPYRAYCVEAARYAQSESVARQLGPWLERLSSVNPEIPLDGVGPPTAEDVEHRLELLAPGTTRELVAATTGRGRATVRELLLTAFACCLADWSGRKQVVFDVLAHGREPLGVPLDTSRTVGRFTTQFPCPLRLPDPSDPAACLNAVRQQLRSLQRLHFSHGLLRYMRDDLSDALSNLRRCPPSQVLFNYVGQFDQVLLNGSPFSGISLGERSHTAVMHGARPYALELTLTLAERALQMEWRYSANVLSASTLDRLDRSFRKAIVETMTISATLLEPSNDV